MPLSIPLPARAKIIINGAVLENSGTANITLTVHNKANILRDKDVITQAEANTPAKEIYHTIQNAYLFEANRDEWLTIAKTLLSGFETRLPDARPITAHVLELLSTDKIYNALRASRRLIALEADDDIPPPTLPTKGPHSPPSPGPGAAKAPSRGDELDKIKHEMAALKRRIDELGDD